MNDMAEETILFYDTYAILEIISGNANYKNYLKNIGIVTTKLNLMELYYRLYILHGLETAELYYQKYKPFVMNIDAKFLSSMGSPRYCSYDTPTDLFESFMNSSPGSSFTADTLSPTVKIKMPTKVSFKILFRKFLSMT